MRRVLLVIGLILAGCDSGGSAIETGGRNTVAGDWEGQVVSSGIALDVEVTFIEERATVISGQGSVQVAGEARSFVISEGDYLHPLLNINLFFEGFAPPFGGIDGTVNTTRDEINGTMSGPGFSGPAQLTLRRQ